MNKNRLNTLKAIPAGLLAMVIGCNNTNRLNTHRTDFDSSAYDYPVIPAICKDDSAGSNSLAERLVYNNTLTFRSRYLAVGLVFDAKNYSPQEAFRKRAEAYCFLAEQNGNLLNSACMRQALAEAINLEPVQENTELILRVLKLYNGVSPKTDYERDDLGVLAGMLSYTRGETSHLPQRTFCGE